MKKELVLYSLSIGVNRGAVLLYMPFLVHSLSLAEYGEFSYIQILFQLLFPILCLNIPSGIAREGAEDINKGLYVYIKSVPFVIGVTILMSFLAFFLGKIVHYELMIFIVLLGGIEALHNMQLNMFRVLDKHYTYSVYTASKTIGILILIYGFIHFSTINLVTVLLLQVGWHFFIFLIFSIIFFMKKHEIELKKVDFRPVLIFSIFLIPHIISQWVMGASNRIIVKNLLGGQLMGIYSISYTISMVMLLFNSGLAIVVPQNFIKDPELWLSSKFKSKFFIFYSGISFFIFASVLFFLYINKYYLNLIKYDNYPVAFYFSIITSSFYILGYYFYYVNILFYHKKSKLISFATLTVAIFSIGSGYLLTRFFGIIGASVSMLVAYVFYYILIFFLAKKAESRLSFNLFADMILPAVTVILMIVISYYFSNHYLNELVNR